MVTAFAPHPIPLSSGGGVTKRPRRGFRVARDCAVTRQSVECLDARRGLPRRDQITGVILAGGRGRRMGGIDKGLYPYSGRPLIEWTIAALAPQVGQLMINANRSQDAYRAYGLPLIADTIPDYPGPLAGIAAALTATQTPWLLVAPCDTPLLPPDLAERLAAALARDAAELALAHDGQRRQPLHALLPVTLATSLERFLVSGQRKVGDWYAGHRVAIADLSDQADGFVNINTPAMADRPKGCSKGR